MGDYCSKSVLADEIILRKLEIADAEPMLEWLLDPNIYEKMQYDPKQQSLEGCCAFIRKSWDDESNLHYAISNRENTYLGTVSLKNIDKKNQNAELGIVVHPFAMRLGVATKALRAIFQKAFEDLGLNKVYLCVRCDNERAVEFYRKNKMTCEGCFKQHLFVMDHFRDIFWFSMQKSEYVEWRKNRIDENDR